MLVYMGGGRRKKGGRGKKESNEGGREREMKGGRKGGKKVYFQQDLKQLNADIIWGERKVFFFWHQK